MEVVFLEPLLKEKNVDFAWSTKKVKLCDGMAEEAVASSLKNGSESGVAVEWRRKSSFKDVLQGQSIADFEMWDSEDCSVDLSDDDSNCESDELTDDD